jgi:phage baseplate assembly protein W
MSFDLKIQRGDLVLDSSGQLNIVERNDKLVQDIIKVLLTDLGENKFHPYYGSPTGKLDVGSILDQDFFKTKIEDGVIQAINNLIALQKNQSKYQYITPGETILEVSGVRVSRDTNDPRMWSVFVSVITLELEEISQTVTIRI